MILLDEIKNAIRKEYNTFKEKMYAGKSLEERQELDQFFTPPEITIPMIEKFDCDSLAGKTILDPTSGSGNLLVACLIAGADADKIYGNDYDAKMVSICRERIRNVCEQLGKERFEYYQIHRGNALDSFCLNYFGENYDACYFGRKNASDESKLETLEDYEANARAARRLQKINAKEYNDYYIQGSDNILARPTGKSKPKPVVEPIKEEPKKEELW